MLLIALLIIFTHCSESGEEVRSVGMTPHAKLECRSDADCGLGKACHTELGLCLELAPEGLEFSVYVEPAPSSGFLPVVFESVTTDAGGAIDVQLPRPVQVRGICAFAPESPEQTVLELLGGRLIATASTTISGIALISETKVSDQQELGTEWTFSISVLPGVPYILTFLPDERPNSSELSTLPTFFTVDLFDESVTNYRLLLPQKQAYIASTVTGVVTLDSEGQSPVRNAVVTGFAGGLKGTKATTDSQGRFKVVLPPDEWGVTLRVEPDPKDATFVGREFYFDALPQDLKGVHLVLGKQPQKYRLLVHVYGVSGQDLMPVPLAGVKMQRLGEGELEYHASATGKDGVAAFTLFGGSYRLVVTPPADAEFASKEFFVDVISDNQVFHAQLGRRSLVRGVVLSADQKTPVPSAIVTIQTNKVSALSGSPSSGTEMSASVITDNDGLFSVMLDPGLYAVTVVPPASSKLARFSQPVLEIGEEDLFLKISLPHGVLVRGTVTSSLDGAPLPDTRVQFYFKVNPPSRFSEPWSLQDSAFGQVVQLAGFTNTDTLGQFQLTLPPINPNRNEPQYAGEDSGGRPFSFGLPDIEVEKR